MCSALVIFWLSAHTASGFAFPTLFQHVINMPQNKHEQKVSRLDRKHRLSAWSSVCPSFQSGWNAFTLGERTYYKQITSVINNKSNSKSRRHTLTTTTTTVYFLAFRMQGGSHSCIWNVNICWRGNHSLAAPAWEGRIFQVSSWLHATIGCTYVFIIHMYICYNVAAGESACSSLTFI